MTDHLPQPDRHTVSRHVRQHHGFTIEQTYSTAEVALIGEHNRIHATLDVEFDHDHEEVTDAPSPV